MQYVIAFVLCVVIAFVYSSTRRDTPREIIQDGVTVLLWMLSAIAALVVFAFIGTRIL